jgi:hypothetical protein
MLEILGVESLASGSCRGRDDSRVIDMQPVIPGDPNSIVVNFGRKRQGIAAQLSDRRERFRDIFPWHVEFAPGDSDELVQNLDTDQAALVEQSFCDLAP